MDVRLTPTIPLPTKYDFEKYDYTYRVWGRNLYNPDGDADGWRRSLAQQFGKGAEPAELALASASRILPLVTTAHCPSAANNNYWPEMYWNMPMVDARRKHPYSDTASPKLFGNVSPLDPEFFSSCDEFSDELLKGESSGKYSPVWVAGQLEDSAQKAADNLHAAKSKVRDAKSADFRRLAADVTLQAGLGKFYAAKFRAGVLYAIYQRSLHRPALEQALTSQRAARAAWAELADAAKNIYRSDVTFGPEYFQRGHWLDRLAAMDDDIADMEQSLELEPSAHVGPTPAEGKLAEQAMRVVLEKPKHDEPPPAEFHTPPASFKRGQPLALVAHAPKAAACGCITGTSTKPKIGGWLTWNWRGKIMPPPFRRITRIRHSRCNIIFRSAMAMAARDCIPACNPAGMANRISSCGKHDARRRFSIQTFRICRSTCTRCDTSLSIPPK